MEDIIREGVDCLICRKGKFEKDIITETIEYKNKKKKIPNVLVYTCSHCGEIFHSTESIGRLEKEKIKLITG